MNITRYSIRKPIGISMIAVFFIILGLFSFYRIGVELLPSINIPYVTVTVKYPGAGAQAQSEIPVMWDTILTAFNGSGAIDTAQFNHVPGGTNVLFMDGHVEFGKYPQNDGSKMFMVTKLVQTAPKGQPFP